MKKSVVIIIALTLLPFVLHPAAISNPKKKLLDESILEDIKQVNLAIFHGADVNTEYEKKQNALHGAAKYGFTRTANALIKAGATIDALDYLQRTPLHLAADNGRTEIVNALIKAKANINAIDKHQRTPLHLACRYGHIDAVNALIKSDASVNFKDIDQVTPLHLAAGNCNSELVKTLILANAIIDARNNRQEMPLHYCAIRSNGTAAVNVLVLAKATIDARNNIQMTPLLCAAKHANIEIVDLLIKAKADLTAIDSDNSTIFDQIKNSHYRHQSIKDEILIIIEPQMTLIKLPKLIHEQIRLPLPIAKMITEYAHNIDFQTSNKRCVIQ